CWTASRVRATALLTAGDLDAVDRLTEREARTATERRLPRHQWLSLRLRAALAMLRGEFADSERLAGDAYELGRRAIGSTAAHGPRRAAGVPAQAPGPSRPGGGAAGPPGRRAGQCGRGLAGAPAPGLRRPGTRRRRPPPPGGGHGRPARPAERHQRGRPGRRL